MYHKKRGYFNVPRADWDKHEGAAGHIDRLKIAAKWNLGEIQVSSLSEYSLQQLMNPVPTGHASSRWHLPM